MGQLDLQQSEYFDSNVRFADICNGILFNSTSVIQPEELDSCATELLLKTVDIDIDIEAIKEFKDGKEQYNLCKAIDDMKNDARNEGYKSGMDDAIKTSIKSLMKSLNLSLEQAMDALQIEEEMREKFYI